MIKVLCTLRFTEEQLNKLRAVSPRLVVEQRTCHHAEEVRTALDEDTEVLYAYRVPDDLLSRAPKLRWLQLHSAGVNHLLAGFSPHYDDRASDLFAENLRRYLAGGELLNLVDKEAGY